MTIARNAGKLPTAVVFDCKGAAEGAISVVRTLGRAGVPVVVVGDDVHTPTARSRFCQEFLHVPEFTRRPVDTVERLRRFAETQTLRPVLFPTADPDLALVSDLRADLQDSFAHFVAPADLVTALSDKRRFVDLARTHGFPVPRTFIPFDGADLRRIAGDVRYPVVLKPSHPAAWSDPRIQHVVRYRKALVLESRRALEQAYDAVARHNAEVLVQEWIPGNDDAHYSLHVYMDAQSQPLALFTGRKVRVYPAYAGSGCFVRSVHVERMVEIGVEMLQQIAYTGIAVINFKRDERDGEFVVHEINPRISQWNILPTRCGVNIPWIAYADAAGLGPVAAGRQSERWRYVHLRNDLKALAAYRRRGEWPLPRYVQSLFGGACVHQLLALDDMGPLLSGYRDAMRARLFARVRAPVPSGVPQSGPSRPAVEPQQAAPALVWTLSGRARRGRSGALAVAESHESTNQGKSQDS